MTESDWLASVEPEKMFQAFPGSVSDRKCRLFACACARRAGSLLTRASVRDALHVAEAFAEGLVSVEALRLSHADVRRALSMTPLGTRWEHALMAVLHATSEACVVPTAILASQAAARALDDEYPSALRAFGESLPNPRWRIGSPRERAHQCRILRDLLPYHATEVEPGCLTWQLGQVPSLARGIALEERFSDLPILADALEEAGCISEAILGHCRGPGLHVRGCWLLDLLTERDVGVQPAR